MRTYVYFNTSLDENQVQDSEIHRDCNDTIYALLSIIVTICKYKDSEYIVEVS